MQTLNSQEYCKDIQPILLQFLGDSIERFSCKFELIFMRITVRLLGVFIKLRIGGYNKFVVRANRRLNKPDSLMSHIVTIFSLMIFLTSSGCMWVRDLLNLPQQNWVTIEDKPILLGGYGLHIRIKDGVIWEAGNEALDVGKQIEESLKILIDDRPIAESRFLFISTLQFPQEVYADNGRRLGSHYDSTDVYIRELNLREGSHKGFIEVKSLSGVTYTYSWQFIVKYTQ
jgi:hypothetical protein